MVYISHIVGKSPVLVVVSIDDGAVAGSCFGYTDDVYRMQPKCRKLMASCMISGQGRE